MQRFDSKVLFSWPAIGPARQRMKLEELCLSRISGALLTWAALVPIGFRSNAEANRR